MPLDTDCDKVALNFLVEFFNNLIEKATSTHDLAFLGKVFPLNAFLYLSIVDRHQVNAVSLKLCCIVSVSN